MCGRGVDVCVWEGYGCVCGRGVESRGEAVWRVSVNVCM